LITFCQAKEWLLTRMPPPDQHSLPGSVTVKHASLLDDTASFTIMALHAAPWARQLPRAAQFAYLLPYSTYRESLSSWRPLYFARFFQRVANASSTAEAMKLLTQPGWSPEAHNSFTDVFRDIWPDYGADPAVARDTYLQWSSSTAPPVLAPFDFTAYGYGSCTAHALLLVYIARSVGIPARLVRF
jgi:transglutaminase-like putative cysteine protease